MKLSNHSKTTLIVTGIVISFGCFFLSMRWELTRLIMGTTLVLALTTFVIVTVWSVIENILDNPRGDL